VEISLYGLARSVYEKVVAVPGAYDRCLAGISRVVAGQHPLALKCPVTRDNAHEIAGIAAFAKDLGVDFRYDPVILATMEGGREPHALRLAAEEIVAFEAKDIEKDRAWRKFLIEEPQPEIDSSALFSCGAGKNSLHIDPYGNVQVCLMVKNFKHSLRERDLAEIYFEEFPRILALRREETSHCGSCKSRAVCNNCPGIALWETGTNQSHVDFLCTLSGVREKTYRGALEDAGGAPEPKSGACGGCGSGCDRHRPPLLQIGGAG